MFALLTLLRPVDTELKRPPCAAESMLRSHLKSIFPCAVIDLLSYTGTVCTVCLFPGLFWLSRTQQKGPVRWYKVAWSAPVPNSASLGPIPLTAPCSNKQEKMHIIINTASCTHTHTQLTQLFLAPRSNTVQPRLSFRHRACYRVIALLINVSLSQDNGLVFTVRFSRLAMRGIQWCNLLSVHYALHGSPCGTLFPGSSQVTHLQMHYFSLLPFCFSLLLINYPLLYYDYKVDLYPAL